jgi:type IV secretory pathway component VirB8
MDLIKDIKNIQKLYIVPYKLNIKIIPLDDFDGNELILNLDATYNYPEFKDIINNNKVIEYLKKYNKEQNIFFNFMLIDNNNEKIRFSHMIKNPLD